MASILRLFMISLVAAETRATGHDDIRPLMGQEGDNGMIQESGTGQGGRGGREEQTRAAAVSSLLDSASRLSVSARTAAGRR